MVLPLQLKVKNHHCKLGSLQDWRLACVRKDCFSSIVLLTWTWTCFELVRSKNICSKSKHYLWVNAIERNSLFSGSWQEIKIIWPVCTQEFYFWLKKFNCKKNKGIKKLWENATLTYKAHFLFARLQFLSL